MNKVLVCLASMSLFLLAACGGGGGGTTNLGGVNQNTTTSMTLTIALQGANAGMVKGIQTNIIFPAGVVLRTDATGQPLAGVVVATGSASSGLLSGKFTPATTATAGTLNVGLITDGSLIAGDVITINADLAAGTTSPAASAFTFSGTTLIDDKTSAVSGASLSIR